jgi:hypothetical protein
MVSEGVREGGGGGQVVIAVLVLDDIHWTMGYLLVFSVDEREIKWI